MSVIEFSLTKTEPMTFNVDGIRDNEGQLPEFLTKDMTVKLISGKWPLEDYRDCDRHTFVFEKDDGSQFSMLLSGFTYTCAWSKEKQHEELQSGARHIRISLVELIMKESEDAMSHPEFE